MEQLIKILKEKELTISCAESLTAGLFAASLARYPGISKIFQGGVVTYSAEAKRMILQVPEQIIEEYGVVSSECASEMARGVKNLFHTDVAVSFTGNAGPDTLEGKPVGLVYIGIGIHQTVFTFECRFEGDRNHIREACVSEAVKRILELL